MVRKALLSLLAFCLREGTSLVVPTTFWPSPAAHLASAIRRPVQLQSSAIDTDKFGLELEGSSAEPAVAPFSNDTASATTRATIFSATATAGATLAPPEDRLSLWKRRLITSEDPLSIHKIASVVYTLSGAVILATAVVRFGMGPELFSEIPQELLIPTYAFSASNLIMCVASVRMSFLHRRYDLTARNAFLGTAVSSLFSGFYFLWTSPLGPDIFNNQLVTQSCFTVFIVLNFVFIMDTCLRVPEVVEGRRDRKAEDYNVRFWIDALGYVFPVAWALPLVLATGYVDAVLYNRPWFFEQCEYIDQMTGTPGMQANLCYLQVLTSLAPSYGALFVTLRDKKLITKKQELAGITIFSTSALIWTIFATTVFFSFMTWS